MKNFEENFSEFEKQDYLNGFSDPKKGKKKKMKRKLKFLQQQLAGITKPKVKFTEHPIEWYNQTETKNDMKNTLLKGGIQIVTAGLAAPYASAALGKYSPLVGSALILTGLYMGDKTGLVTALGAGILAYGIAKGKENCMDTEKTVKDRLAGVKDDLLCGFLLGLYKPAERPLQGIESTEHPIEEHSTVEYVGRGDTEQTQREFNQYEATQNPVQHNKEVDLSALDDFEDEMLQAGEKFHAKRSKVNGVDNDSSDSSNDDINLYGLNAYELSLIKEMDKHYSSGHQTPYEDTEDDS